MQVVEIADRMYGSADLEQCVQVARDAGVCWKLLENSIRLQVERILWTELRRRLGHTVFVLNPARSRFLGFVIKQQQEDRITNGYLVSVTQACLFDGHAIHQCAIPAIEVPYFVTVAVLTERAVATRQGRVADGKQIGWVPANVNLRVWESKG